MADAPLSEELQLELSAIEHSYGDLGLQITHDGQQAVVSLLIRPSDAPQYLETRLVMTLGQGYPQSAQPSLSFSDVKGMSDERQHSLLGLLNGESSSLQGELVMGQLIETARSWAEQHNYPEGTCAFCLLDLARRPQEAASDIRLPCFHSFHRECFASWWHWRQGELRGREKELIQHTGASATAMLASEQLPPREPDRPDLFILSCPTCRTPAPLDTMHDSRKLLMRKDRRQQQQQEDTGSSSTATSTTQAADSKEWQGVLSPSWARQRQAMQARWRRQAEAGGIITEHDPSLYSISRPVQPPTTSRDSSTSNMLLAHGQSAAGRITSSEGGSVTTSQHAQHDHHSAGRGRRGGRGGRHAAGGTPRHDQMPPQHQAYRPHSGRGGQASEQPQHQEHQTGLEDHRRQPQQQSQQQGLQHPRQPRPEHHRQPQQLKPQQQGQQLPVQAGPQAGQQGPGGVHGESQPSAHGHDVLGARLQEDGSQRDAWQGRHSGRSRGGGRRGGRGRGGSGKASTDYAKSTPVVQGSAA